MGLFEQKKKVEKEPKEKDEDIVPARVRKAMVAAARAWLAEFEQGGRALEDYVNRYLEERLRKTINAAVGIDDSFHRNEVRWDTPLYKQVQAVAATRAKAIVDKYLEVEEKNLSKKLPDELRKAIDKRYEESFKEELLDLAQERGKQRAQEELENILAAKDKKGK